MACSYVWQDFIVEEEEFSPKEFVSKFRDELPLHVRVSKGFYGNTEKTSVSESDCFNVHFIKNTKVGALFTFDCHMMVM